MKKARFFKKINTKNKEVQCVLCPHNCIIKNKKFGLCRVRQNLDGELQSLSYAKPVSISIDPIEKKPLFHFLPGTKILSIGTMGCNLFCSFCQNYSISQKGYIDAIKSKNILPKEIIKIAKENIGLSDSQQLESSLQEKVCSIACTYNEPTVFYEYSEKISKLAKNNKINMVWVTNGYINKEPLKEILPLIRAFNVDLKSINKNFYAKLTKSKIEPVLKSIKTIFDNNKWIELTLLLIPGENDSDRDLKEIAEWIKNNLAIWVPLHLLSFFPYYKMMDKKPTTMNDLNKAYKIMKKQGLEYVYLGNAQTDKVNTYCPKCNSLLINRLFYKTTLTEDLEINKKTGKAFCKKCNYEIKGIWI